MYRGLRIEQANEYKKLAEDLAFFVNELHSIPVETAPYSRRGVKLTVLDEERQDTLAQLKDDIDVSMVTSLWEKLKDIPCWSKPSIWIHGDLLPENILIKNNQLSVVIDFSDLGLGDPHVI